MYRIKQTLRDKLSDQVYNGFWFSPEGQFTRKCLDIAAESVEGTVKLEVFKGQGKTNKSEKIHFSYNFKKIF